MISTLGKRRGGYREREPDKRVKRVEVLVGWAADDGRCVWRERGASARGEQ